MKQTVYILYYSDDKSLYGYTPILDYVNRFLDERNPNCFVLKEKKMTEMEFSIFSNNHRRELMCKFPYETKENISIEMIATYKEDELLTAKIEEIQANVEIIERTIRKCNMKKKYAKVLNRLTTLDDGSGNLTLDTLAIFIDIHKRSFIESDSIKDELSLWDSQSVNSYDDVLDYF